MSTIEIATSVEEKLAAFAENRQRLRATDMEIEDAEKHLEILRVTRGDTVSIGWAMKRAISDQLIKEGIQSVSSSGFTAAIVPIPDDPEEDIWDRFDPDRPTTKFVITESD